MIGVIAQGRMGNQMFQYAFAYSSAKKLNTSFFIYNQTSLQYFKLDKNQQANNRKRMILFGIRNWFGKSRLPFSFSSGNALLNWAVHKHIITWNNRVGGGDYLLKEVKNNTLYEGYFQSEEYFKQDEKHIRQLFEIEEKYTGCFLKEKKTLLEKKYIALHIRRSDYINYGGEELGGYDMTLPVQYYKKCLAMVDGIENYKVVFVSDDIDFVRKEFGENANYSFECNDEITDFQILQHAHILITANSTYSWWAAWLSKVKDVVVYAPDYFLGFKVKQFYPAGIKVDDWNWINVY